MANVQSSTQGAPTATSQEIPADSNKVDTSIIAEDVELIELETESEDETMVEKSQESQGVKYPGKFKWE